MSPDFILAVQQQYDQVTAAFRALLHQVARDQALDPDVRRQRMHALRDCMERGTADGQIEALSNFSAEHGYKS